MDLNDYPMPSKALPWKWIALGVGAVVLVIIVLVVVIRFVQQSRQEEILLENGGTQSQIEQCNTTEDPDACKEHVLEEQAIATGSTQGCDVLSSQEDRDNCYWGVARATSDATVCMSLSVEEESDRCADDVMEAQALALADETFCEQIQDLARQSRCRDAVSGPLTSENCAQRNPEMCEDIQAYELAIATVRVEPCEGILDESIQLSCYDAVEDRLVEAESQTNQDSDADGLTDEEEVTYGTDPQNSDTDGDGYTDGGEVAAGYDPNGPGRLE